MPATSVLTCARASTRRSGGGAVGRAAIAQNEDIKAMSSHIPHPPFRVENWSRGGPAATGHLREWRRIVGLALTLFAAGCGATYRAVRPTEAVEAARGTVHVEVQRV